MSDGRLRTHQDICLYVIDRDRPAHVLKADEAAYVAKVEARRRKSAAQSGSPAPIQSTSEAVNK